MNKCGDCKWLCGKQSTIGIECLHPDRPFLPNCSNVAHYKYKSSNACKRFEQKDIPEKEESGENKTMTEGEKLLCRMLELFLDEHPDRMIYATLHVVDGEWKHQIEIKKKPIAKF